MKRERHDRPIVSASGFVPFADNEATAYREVGLFGHLRAARIEGSKAHRVRMARPGFPGVEQQVARFFERDSMLAQQVDGVRSADLPDFAFHRIGVHPIRDLARESQQDRAVGSVAPAGEGQRPIEFHQDARGWLNQRHSKLARGAHGPDRVGTGRSDPNLEKLEEAGAHSPMVGAARAIVYAGLGAQ